MRFFVSKVHIRSLNPRTQLLTIVLLAFVLLQTCSGLIMQELGPGWTRSQVVRYYQGDDFDALMAADMPVAMDFYEAPTLHALMEVAHFHLFLIPLSVFLITHVFAMTDFGRRTSMGWLSLISIVAAFCFIVGPFAVRYASISFTTLSAYIYLFGTYVLPLCLLFMGLAAIGSLWRCLRAHTND